jgi:hypothetical protein
MPTFVEIIRCREGEPPCAGEILGPRQELRRPRELPGCLSQKLAEHAARLQWKPQELDPECLKRVHSAQQLLLVGFGLNVSKHGLQRSSRARLAPEMLWKTSSGLVMLDYLARGRTTLKGVVRCTSCYLELLCFIYLSLHA